MILRLHLDPTPTYADVLVAGAQCVLLLCAAWVAALVLAAALEVLSSGRFAATAWIGAPPCLRRALLAGLGLALVGVPGAAGAVPHPSGSPRLPVPARPTGVVSHSTAPPTPSGCQRAGSAGPSSLIVRRGDTLWRLAAVRLAAGADDHDVADLVARLHRRNRLVIGPDADLILPGQRLVVPLLPRRPPHRHLEETP